MSRRKYQMEEEKTQGAPEWMTTYSDMVTLLLCFFVLLYSMAVIDQQKFEQVAESLRSAFLSSGGEMFDDNSGAKVIDIMNGSEGGDLSKSNIEDDKDLDEETLAGMIEAQKKKEKIDEFIEEVREYIEDMELAEHVKVIEEEEQVILRIDSVILFDLGKADIKESGKDTLREVGKLLKEIDSEVVVQGHTDNLPINTTLFPTNWELSTKRATNVVLFLVDESDMDPLKLTATGNGEFRPIAPNDTPENRQKNRRVDIVVDK
ncbi:MAG: OmpA family protein [Clostridium sp.]|nr:OmpA family protein [Clostridium sp.]